MGELGGGGRPSCRQAAMLRGLIAVFIAAAAFCSAASDRTEGADVTAELSFDDVQGDGLLGETREKDVVPMTASKKAWSKANKGAAKELSLVPPSYSLDEKKQIAHAQTTPIAKFYNGSFENITKAGKLEDMVTEYMSATKKMAIDKDLARIKGNNNTKIYSNVNNPVLDDYYKKEYKTRVALTNASLNAYREKWNSEMVEIRMAHALLCKNLSAPGGNPYPKGSMQYKAVAKACLGEDPANLKNSTAIPLGAHDYVRGPYANEAMPNASEVKSVNDQLANSTLDATLSELDELGDDEEFEQKLDSTELAKPDLDNMEDIGNLVHR